MGVCTKNHNLQTVSSISQHEKHSSCSLKFWTPAEWKQKQPHSHPRACADPPGPSLRDHGSTLVGLLGFYEAIRSGTGRRVGAAGKSLASLPSTDTVSCVSVATYWKWQQLVTWLNGTPPTSRPFCWSSQTRHTQFLSTFCLHVGKYVSALYIVIIVLVWWL